ncbi:hypothetical protein OAO01_04000 [Oligoflexia bacterium]|nr:hypothetical protein [Oligoflexia bacterium]
MRVTIYKWLGLVMILTPLSVYAAGEGSNSGQMELHRGACDVSQHRYSPVDTGWLTKNQVIRISLLEAGCSNVERSIGSEARAQMRQVNTTGSINSRCDIVRHSFSADGSGWLSKNQKVRNSLLAAGCGNAERSIESEVRAQMKRVNVTNSQASRCNHALHRSSSDGSGWLTRSQMMRNSFLAAGCL